MRPTQYVRPATAFALSGTKTKHPRREDKAHLKAIRACPCLSCGSRVGVEAAHIRAGSLQFAKPPAGAGEKSSDKWALPLCAECHRTGPGAQHSMNEIEFWEAKKINPFVTALALWSASGSEDHDQALMETIIRAARGDA